MTTEFVTKFVPVKAIVVPALPAVAEAGLMLVKVGMGFDWEA